jgi:hypothetical protein
MPTPSSRVPGFHTNFAQRSGCRLFHAVRFPHAEVLQHYAATDSQGGQVLPRGGDVETCMSLTRCAVDAVFVERERRFNRRFLAMCIEPTACTPAEDLGTCPCPSITD